MKLVLTILDPGQAKARSVSRSLEKGSLTIGRAAAADWMIDDPERVLSKLHCRVEAKSGRFVLTDASTNGVYVNGSSLPVGEGKTSVLNDGDRLQLGSTTIAVTIDMDTPRTTPFLPDDSFVDILGKAYTKDTSGIDATGLGLPNAVLEDWAAPSAPSASDRVPIQHQAFKPPPVIQSTPKLSVAAAIPDDWHMEVSASLPVPPLNGDHAAERIGATAPEISSHAAGTERQYRALVAGLASLAAGNAALRAALGCSVDFTSPNSLLTATDAKTLQTALSSGDGSAVTDVLAGGLAHQTALLTALRTALDRLTGSSALDFKSTLATTYRQVFESETRHISARKK